MAWVSAGKGTALLDTARKNEFRSIIHEYFKKSGRRLPWRETRDPYAILVSEFMLQQTQVERVLSKYDNFLQSFPTFQSLAEAGLRDVMAQWQGLGYNRRAASLHKTAQLVVADFNGILPQSTETLRQLPGIGAATAGALRAFVYNQPVVFIETNIRRVFIHFFFADAQKVADWELLPFIEATLDRKNVRDWYYALMDYGAMLKKQPDNPNRRSAHYSVQSRFEGSDRQIRGAILRVLLGVPEARETDIIESLAQDPPRIQRIIERMVAEGLLERDKHMLRIASGRE